MRGRGRGGRPDSLGGWMSSSVTWIPWRIDEYLRFVQLNARNWPGRSFSRQTTMYYLRRQEAYLILFDAYIPPRIPTQTSILVLQKRRDKTSHQL